jgi:hypothetical protein
MTVSLMLETALRRPKELRLAIEYSLMHKHLYEYSRDTGRMIEQLVREIKRLPQELHMLPASTPDAA